MPWKNHLWKKRVPNLPRGGKPLIYKRNEYCEYCAYAIKGQIEEENQDATKILFDENSPKK